MILAEAASVVPEGWEAQAAQKLTQRLRTHCPGWVVEIIPSCGSSNDELLQRARAHEPERRILVAWQQTQGRGRNGRAWESAVGDCLTFSLSLPWAGSTQGLSLALGTALAQALDPGEERAPQIRIKWPNDLLLHERKLCGLLVESLHGRALVIGCGINLLPMVAGGEQRAGLTQLPRFAGFADAWGRLGAVLLIVAPALIAALERFARNGFAAFATGFAQRDALLGRWLRLHGTAPHSGIGAGVSAEGALLIRENDVMHAVYSDEVSVEPFAPIP